jgi:hypothetical protein
MRKEPTDAERREWAKTTEAAVSALAAKRKAVVKKVEAEKRAKAKGSE